MLKKIIALSLKNRFLVILGTLFVIAWGTYSMLKTPLDAIPDLSDVQVIIFTKYPGQAPQIVEDQITYPLTTAMLSDTGYFRHTGDGLEFIAQIPILQGA